MQDDRGCDDPRGPGCCGGGFLNGLFGDDNGILFFLVVFLLLFTNNGCPGRR